MAGRIEKILAEKQIELPKAAAPVANYVPAVQAGNLLFTAGQVTYAWETREAGMALVGDLPPDLHEAVLAAMPHPEDPGLFRRWWRALFG